METDLVVAGAGGFAREVAWLIKDLNREQLRWNLVGFWDSEPAGSVMGLPVFTTEEILRMPGCQVVVAVGNPERRARIAREAADAGLSFATLVHPSVRRDPSVHIGAGSILCAGSTLTVDIEIGQHVIVNLHCTIGHDSRIADFVTLSPGCHLSGRTSIAEGAFMGSGAVTVEGASIGSASIIGAGAVVIRDVAPKTTAVGVPARPR